VINAFMASPKGHRFWEMLIDRLQMTFRRRKFLESRGNYIMQTVIFELDKMAREYQKPTMISPSIRARCFIRCHGINLYPKRKSSADGEFLYDSSLRYNLVFRNHVAV